MLNKFFSEDSKLKTILKKMFVDPKIPKHISKNFIEIDNTNLDKIRVSLKKNFFSHKPESYLSTESGKKDLLDHLIRRLENNRKYVIPWLDYTRSLHGANVLEIGCGTGASTVALAEQGAAVTGIDVDEKGLIVAGERCRVYDLNVSLYKANATEVRSLFSDHHFDFIIFYASLDHMTHEERMLSIKDTWNMLSAGDLLCVVETPNRLWYFDSHTSHLPFYHWLPDDLAIQYSRFSPRPFFSERYRHYDENSKFHFLRSGRCVSFHEFELSMNSFEKLNVISALSVFMRKQRILSRLKWRLSKDYWYESFLTKIKPKIHIGFYQPYLNLIIEKD